VDRSAAYMGRYRSRKNIVAAGPGFQRPKSSLPTRVGFPDPVSVCINTFGTGVVSDEELERAVLPGLQFQSLRPLSSSLTCCGPIYSKTTKLRGTLEKSDPDNHLGKAK